MSSETSQKERDVEDYWLINILPYWDEACVHQLDRFSIDLPSILRKKAIWYWRSGIPSRLRAYVWQRLIGNKLDVSPEVYSQCQANAQQKFGNFEDEEVSEESEFSETILTSSAEESLPTTPKNTREQPPPSEGIADSTPEKTETVTDQPSTQTTESGKPQEDTPLPTEQTPQEPQNITTSEDDVVKEVALPLLPNESIRAIIDPVSTRNANVRHQIMKDVPRTFPDLRLFDKRTPAYMQLQTVLETAALFMDIGYVRTSATLFTTCCLYRLGSRDVLHLWRSSHVYEPL